MRPPRATLSSGNQLLNLLSSIDPDGYARLQPQLKRVELPRGTVLVASGEAPRFVYFIDSGIASVVADGASGESIEVSLVGIEGVTGFVWALSSVPTPFSYMAPLPVTVRRLDAAAAAELFRGPQPNPLRCLLQSYVGVQLAVVAQSVLCARHHTVVERMARWLLLTSTRLRATVLPFTHELVGHAIGSPRSLVTEAAALLRSAGAITYRRGNIVIETPVRLKAHVCECFPIMRQRFTWFDRLIARTLEESRMRARPLSRGRR